jgi:hypothetical protein
MGFNMIKNYKPVLIFFAAFSITIFSTSCMKEPDLNQNFGPETSASEISSALEKIPVASVATLNEGEFTYVETSNKIESLPPQVYKQKSTTLTTKTDCLNKKDSNGNPLPKNPGCSQMSATNGYWLVFTNEHREMDNAGNMKPSIDVTSGPLLVAESQNTLSLAKALSPPANLGSQSGILQDLSLKTVITYGSSPSGRKYTYHNFRMMDGYVGAPLLVQKRSDCGGIGLNNCNDPLKVKEVRFDGVDWTGDQPVKTSFVYLISPDVPITSNELVQCASSTVAYNGSRIAVTQCREVKDFSFGTKPATP